MTGSPSVSRRALLAGVGAVAFCAPSLIGCANREANRDFGGANPFKLGVASGEPGPNGVVLWTRLATVPLSQDPVYVGGMIPKPVRLRWEVAEDEPFTRLAASGEAIAAPEDAHSVHVEVAGLAPGRWYFYRFIAGDAVSPIGRTRTAPGPTDPVDRLRLAVASCSNYEQGYFAGYRHMAEDAPDLCLFLGDYIYAYTTAAAKRAQIVRENGAPEATDLAGYRQRYALYRTDPDLARLHAAAPCLVTWDDHEVDNDYGGDYSALFASEAAFHGRRAAAYQAYWEHMPLAPSRRPRPGSASLPLYRSVSWGRLAEIALLDGRQFRPVQPCGTPPWRGGRLVTDRDCPERLDPARSMLGSAQEAWLYDLFARTRRGWTLIAQDLLMAQLKQRADKGEAAWWTDGWEGYPANRARLIETLAKRRTPNPVVLGGDFHAFWVTDLKADFDDPRAPTVATEFVGTSISALGPPYERFARLLPDNPHMRFFDSRQRGYLRVDVGQTAATCDLRVIADARDPASPVATLRSYRIDDGRPGAVPIAASS